MHKLSIECPTCNRKQNVEVPAHVLQDGVKGISTLALKAPCGHNFHVFVDRKLSIRGYQRSDFDVISDSPAQQSMTYSLLGMVKMIGEEPFIMAMRAILLNQKIILYGSDRPVLKSLFIDFISLFERDVPDTTGALEIMSKEEFGRLDPVQLSTALVIDLDFSTIKHKPNRMGSPTIERNLLKEILNIKNADSQKEAFKVCISRIFMYSSIMVGFIKQGSTRLKDIKSAMAKRNKNLVQNEVDLAWTIANSRCIRSMT